jgi:hypothetical protein
MKNIFQLALPALALVALFLTVESNAQNSTSAKFEISFPATLDKGPIDGRLLLLISTSTEGEPRQQINEDLNTQQVFGIDVDGWKPGEKKTITSSAFGYPRRSLADIPPGEYTVQVLLHRYETFKRADGHTVKLPMDRGEGHSGTALREISTARRSACASTAPPRSRSHSIR